MKSSILIGSLCLVLAIAISSSPGRCAEVGGAVRNAEGKPVAGVRIVAQAKDSGSVHKAAYNPGAAGPVTKESVTDSNGRYTLGDVQPGAYVFKLEPLNTGVKPGDGVGNVGKEGLTLDWMASPNATALAMATPGAPLLQTSSAGAGVGGGTGGGGGGGGGIDPGLLGALGVGAATGIGLGVAAGTGAIGGSSGTPASTSF